MCFAASSRLISARARRWVRGRSRGCRYWLQHLAAAVSGFYRCHAGRNHHHCPGFWRRAHTAYTRLIAPGPVAGIGAGAGRRPGVLLHRSAAAPLAVGRRYAQQKPGIPAGHSLWPACGCPVPGPALPHSGPRHHASFRGGQCDRIYCQYPTELRVYLRPVGRTRTGRCRLRLGDRDCHVAESTTYRPLYDEGREAPGLSATSKTGRAGP